MSGTVSKLVRNERLKLQAAGLNSIAVASVVAGFVTPLVASTFGLEPVVSRGTIVTVVSSLAWLAVGAVVHSLANIFLGGLQE